MEKIIKELEQKKSELLKEAETIEKAIKTLSKKDISTAEKWLLERIEGAKPKIYPSGNVDWYNKDGERLFEQDLKNGWLPVNYRNVWSVLEKQFGLKDYEIFDLLTKVLCDYTDNGKLVIYNTL